MVLLSILVTIGLLFVLIGVWASSLLRAMLYCALLWFFMAVMYEMVLGKGSLSLHGASGDELFYFAHLSHAEQVAYWGLRTAFESVLVSLFGSFGYAIKRIFKRAFSESGPTGDLGGLSTGSAAGHGSYEHGHAKATADAETVRNAARSQSKARK
jgi:hypothetical protein